MYRYMKMCNVTLMLHNRNQVTKEIRRTLDVAVAMDCRRSFHGTISGMQTFVSVAVRSIHMRITLMEEKQYVS